MKVTMYNKDDIARELAAKAWNEPNDDLANKMFRVSDALVEVGITFSRFRTLESLDDVCLPRTDYEPVPGQNADELTSITYRQALDEVLPLLVN